MKSILALLLLPITAWAASPYDYESDGNSHKLLETSVAAEVIGGVLTVGAIWEIATPKNNWRWIVHVQNCGKHFGVINILGDGGKSQFTWSSEGMRVYDYLAVATCSSYLFSKPKDKK